MVFIQDETIGYRVKLGFPGREKVFKSVQGVVEKQNGVLYTLLRIHPIPKISFYRIYSISPPSVGGRSMEELIVSISL